jgi:hypothetical protein
MSYDCKKRGHIGKVVDTEYNLIDGQVEQKVVLWGCTACPETSEVLWEDFGEYTIDKKPCSGDCDCFGCKIKTLQLNAGDATRDIPDKKWTAELKAYKDARAQGMQPAGTSAHHVQEAHKASELLGKAYNSETMPKAKDINKKSAEVLKQIGQV